MWGWSTLNVDGLGIQVREFVMTIAAAVVAVVQHYNRVMSHLLLMMMMMMIYYYFWIDLPRGGPPDLSLQYSFAKHHLLTLVEVLSSLLLHYDIDV